MAQLIVIRKVVVGAQYLTATVQVAPDGPLYTSEDLEATTRIYNLMPSIVDQACMGDGGTVFRDVMGDTEVAHLLEHVTIELLARTNLAGDVSVGRTWLVDEPRRLYDVQLACPDDALVAGALSSAVWLVNWAFAGGGAPVPDVDATVAGLVSLVSGLVAPGEQEPDGLDAPVGGADGGAAGAPEASDGSGAEDGYADDGYAYDEPDSDEPADDDLPDRGPSMSYKVL